MSEPEISRRCPECGASIRVRALFCPGCGHAFPEAPTSAAGPASGEQQKQSAPVPEREARKGVPSRDPNRADVGSAQAGAKQHARGGVQRASSTARDVLEDNVEKLRHVSSVVLDEAGYDPSLRFVLVAAILFVLFLVLLFLSKWLG
jgi:hypothetical protein